MLDMRGKKKKGKWEKFEHGDWLPASPLGANRHSNQLGFSLTQSCRMKQRKVYPTDASLKKALLSMLPKRLRDAEMSISEDRMIYGETNNYIARLMYDDGFCPAALITKKKGGWSLKLGEDTIRSLTRDFLEEEKLRKAHFANIESKQSLN